MRPLAARRPWKGRPWRVAVLLTAIGSGGCAPSPAAEAPASAPPAAPASAVPPVDAGASSDAAVETRDCDNGVGAPGDCFSIAAPEAGACGDVTHYWTQGVCTGLQQVFVPRVGERFAACLIDGSGTRAACDSEAVLQCALGAMKQACPVPGVAAACDDFLGRCEPTPETKRFWDRELCIGALSSIDEEGRADAVDCMKDDCDLKLCVSQVY